MIVLITHSVPKGKLVNIPCTYRAWFMSSPAVFFWFFLLVFFPPHQVLEVEGASLLALGAAGGGEGELIGGD
jgi:hypothetical protein